MRFLSTSCLPVQSAASRHARGSAMWPSKGSFAHRPRLKISFKNSVASDVVEVVEELRSTTGLNDKNAMAGVKAVGKIVAIEIGPKLDTLLQVHHVHVPCGLNMHHAARVTSKICHFHVFEFFPTMTGDQG